MLFLLSFNITIYGQEKGFSLKLLDKNSAAAYSCEDKTVIVIQHQESKSSNIQFPFSLSKELDQKIKKLVPSFKDSIQLETQRRTETRNGVFAQVTDYAPELLTSFGTVMKQDMKNYRVIVPIGGTILGTKKFESGKSYTLFALEFRRLLTKRNFNEGNVKLFSVDVKITGPSKVVLGGKSHNAYVSQEVWKAQVGEAAENIEFEKTFVPEMGVALKFSVNKPVANKSSCQLTELRLGSGEKIVPNQIK